jgi:hypothetical protein
LFSARSLRQGQGHSKSKDFYEIDEWKQCELLIELIERIGRTHVCSLEELAENEGRSPDVIWAEMCKERASSYAPFPSAC